MTAVSDEEKSGVDSGEKPEKKSGLPRAVLPAMFVIISATVMDHLDSTIMNVAGPVLSRDLKASTSALQWIVAGYTLAFAVMLTTGGRLGDVFGRKRVFLIGVAGFLIGSMLCVVAPNAGMLIASRILQGAFAAVMIPQGLGMLKQMVPPDKVTAVFGVFGPMVGAAVTVGPILGGWLVNADLLGLSWRAVFLVNVPIAVVTLVFAVRVLPADQSRDSAAAPRLDLVGMLLATGAVMLLVYPLVQGREAGWPAWTFVMMASCLPAFGIFVFHQRVRSRAGRDPFVVPSLFRKRRFTSGLAVMTAFSAAISGIVFSATLFLQIGGGFTALHAGLTMIPMSVGTIFSIVAGQGVLPRLGPRRTLQLGMLVMAAGTWYLAVAAGRHGLHTTSWQLAAPLFVTGAGIGLAFGPIFGTVLGDVDEHEVGSASGLLTAVEQLAAALGIATLGTVFFDKAVPAHAAADYVGAAKLVFGLSAGLLVVAWALAFSMSKHARDQAELL